LPETPNAGSTVSFVIDGSTPEYDPTAAKSLQIYPVDDAYVRDGSYASTNYGSDLLIVKQDNADGYRREFFLKFNLDGLDPDTIDKAELVLTVNSANTNIAVTTWELYYVSDDTWSESSLAWSNKPASSTLLGSFPGSPAGTKAIYNLKQAVLTELAADKKLSMRMVSTQRGDGKTDAAFVSKETGDSDTKPHILITEKRAADGIASIKRLAGITLLGNPVKRGEPAVLYFDAPSDAVVTLSDMYGRTVSKSLLSALGGKNRLELNTSGLTSGLYLIRLTDGNNTPLGLVKMLVK
ncbi:MAG: DNRLRE domain-containing protein, partial [Prevotella sp.]|nr:DNRLRE domain-containing protein [Prevotella sp.]